MAWPRSKKSRSSALPGTSEHDGVQVSVTPAPDADRAEGTKQNAGVNGATYSVSDRPGSPTSRWNAGGRRSANGRQAASPPKAAGVQYADSGVDDVSAEIDEATDVNGGRRRDDGIAILEGVVTTEVPPDEPPTADLDVPQPAWNQQVSRPRPVRAAATGSAAAGERTSSGELPVSVTPPAWDSGQRPDPRPRPAARRAAAHVAVPRDHHDRRRRRLRDSRPGTGRSASTLAILAGDHRHRVPVADRRGHQRPAAARPPRSGAPGRQLSQDAARRVLRAERAAHPRQPGSHRPPGHRPDRRVRDRLGEVAPSVPIRTLNGKQLYHGPESQKDRLEHAVWEAQQASELLSTALGTEITVRPALAIYGPKIPWDIATIRNVDVFTGPALRQVPEAPRPDARRRAAAHPRGSPDHLRHGEQRAA